MTARGQSPGFCGPSGPALLCHQPAREYWQVPEWPQPELLPSSPCHSAGSSVRPSYDRQALSVRMSEELRWMEPCPSPNSSPAHKPGASQARTRLLTVEGYVGKPLEQGNAPAQHFCLVAAGIQLRSVASGDERPALCSAHPVLGGPMSALCALPLPGLTLPPAAPWRRPARSAHCPGPHLLHLSLWQSVRWPGNRGKETPGVMRRAGQGVLGGREDSPGL